VEFQLNYAQCHNWFDDKRNCHIKYITFAIVPCGIFTARLKADRKINLVYRVEPDTEKDNEKRKNKTDIGRAKKKGAV